VPPVGSWSNVSLISPANAGFRCTATLTFVVPPFASFAFATVGCKVNGAAVANAKLTGTAVVPAITVE